MGSAEKKRKKTNSQKRCHPQFADNDEILDAAEVENEQNKPGGKKKMKREKQKNVDSGNAIQVKIQDAAEEENEQNTPVGKKKIKREKQKNIDSGNAVQVKIQDSSFKAAGEKKKNKSNNKMRSVEKNNAPNNEFGKHGSKDGDNADKSNENLVPEVSQVQEENENSRGSGKSKKAKKKKRKDRDSLKEDENSMEKSKEANENDIYFISSGDEDCAKGMKKWIKEYHQSRPGLKVLQERIDEFITTHEAKLEQERKEREALAAEGGWTVVVHHKGRKKTTDAESGIVVGSVAQAAVEDKMAKRKKKEVGLDFYRFQRREAQRNEIMMLQSKFEQDRKRIQQLRAARKFRPY